MIFAFSLFIYYLLFEGIFGTTPIKCHTGTRVVDMYKFQKADFGYILGRSFSRFIPFDSLSYFWFKDWHDTISETLVVEEDNHGASRRYHLWWILAFISIYLIPYLYVNYQNKNKELENDVISKKHKKIQDKSQIFNLENGDILKAMQIQKGYGPEHFLLKVIEQNLRKVSVERYVITAAQSYVVKQHIIKFNFEELELIDTITMVKDSLLAAYGNYRKSVFVNNTTKLNIEEVFSVNHPEIKRAGASYRDLDTAYTTSFHFSYDLMPIDIIDIAKIEGDIQWDMELPLASNFNKEYKNGSFSLNLTSPKRLFTFKSRITLMYGDKLRKYIIEGNRDQCIIYLE